MGGWIQTLETLDIQHTWAEIRPTMSQVFSFLVALLIYQHRAERLQPKDAVVIIISWSRVGVPTESHMA